MHCHPNSTNLVTKRLFYPCSPNDQITLESEMTKIPFLSQTLLIPNKIHTETINHIQTQINTHNKQIK